MMVSSLEGIRESIVSLPVVEGPIETTESSHPFSSMAYCREPLDLATYGYTEEEYFLSGTANVYEEAGESIQIKAAKLPYKNRIFIRKPINSENFSGRVFIDIYNASNGYDIEDVWRRSYRYYMENGDIYIGITSKPINVLSLKNFDYKRYHELNWASEEPAAQPATVNENMSIPGTEEGLFWDMLSQLGSLVRSNKAPFLEDYSVDYLYLTGQSQSGMYLNTYVYYFHPFLKDEDKPLFDGYLNVVGAGVMRSLNQEENENQPFAARPQKVREMDVPFIILSSQGDIELFKVFNPSGAALNDPGNPENKIRHYEVASSPHTDPVSPLIPNNEEIKKTKNPPKILDGEYHYTVNDLQLSYYVNSSLEFLHEWAAKGIAPPAGRLLEKKEDGEVVTDQHGNGLGGVRSPYADVPAATYFANAKAEKDQINQQVGNVNGSMEFFSKDKMKALYGDREGYLNRFKKAVEKQVAEKWLLPSDGKRMVAWAEEVAEQQF